MHTFRPAPVQARGRIMANATVPLHSRLKEVTERVVARSAASRKLYLDRMRHARGGGTSRARLECTNLAHGFAAADGDDKEKLKSTRWPNIAIVSAYNDMLS